MFKFCAPWKRRKSSDFLELSGSIEMEHWFEMTDLFNDRGPYHIETNPLIRNSNQWTGFFMTEIVIGNAQFLFLCSLQKSEVSWTTFPNIIQNILTTDIFHWLKLSNSYWEIFSLKKIISYFFANVSENLRIIQSPKVVFARIAHFL